MNHHVSRVTAGLTVRSARAIEEGWSLVPKRLGGAAFIVSHVQRFLGANSKRPTIEGRCIESSMRRTSRAILESFEQVLLTIWYILMPGSIYRLSGLACRFGG